MDKVKIGVLIVEKSIDGVFKILDLLLKKIDILTDAYLEAKKR
ncbi:MAG: hypothetical protein AB1779_00875 [Candidatus Thermoplasmatota archaeon]